MILKLKSFFSRLQDFMKQTVSLDEQTGFKDEKSTKSLDLETFLKTFKDVI
jgi:hypothetical protein